jgi:serine/threonine-protein kinase PknG
MCYRELHDATSAAGPPTSSAGPPTSSSGPPTSAGGPPTSAASREPEVELHGTGPSRPSRRGASRANTIPARGQLGAGLVDVPPIPVVEPASALLTNPSVPQDRRFCVRCGRPVGRAKGGRPGSTEGVCPKDGTPFSFSPALGPGELVAGQYEVRGCLAHGGMGWIYLAVDRNVDNRWVVLKGLLNSGDADAMAAAVAERRFLAEVNHPNIVKIYNFVQHPGGDGAPVGYIVMEYVGGSSLGQLLDRRLDGDGGALPVAQAIAYALEVLPALGYLHARGLAYCDFKPDNAIQYERQLKLIDLGAVIQIADQRSAVYGTLGYQAPEINKAGPSAQSDVHTVGRSLAVLTLGMPPTRGGRPTPLPREHPVLAAHESFHRLLLRATDPDPPRRFSCAEEMAEQLDGVLREVLAAEEGRAVPATSTRFAQSRGSFAAGLLLGSAGSAGSVDADGASRPGRPDPARVAALLPVPLVDLADPGAGLLATLDTEDRDAVTSAVEAARGQLPELSLELRLRLVRAHLDADDPAAADAALDELTTEHPSDWRLDWLRGLTALHAAAGRGEAAELDRAAAAFDIVYATLPGEAAPKLALAATAECAGRDTDTDTDGGAGAARRYTMIARPDPGLADAVFGRARTALRAGDRAGVLAALDAVPHTASHYVAAQLAAVTATLLGRSGSQESEVGEPALRAAEARVARLDLDTATELRIRARLLTAALRLAPADQPAPETTTFLGLPWRQRELRLGLERCLRGSARLSADRRERIALVDLANSARPLTWT